MSGRVLWRFWWFGSQPGQDKTLNQLTPGYFYFSSISLLNFFSPDKAIVESLSSYCLTQS
jgi:hypothetical protein